MKLIKLISLLLISFNLFAQEECPPSTVQITTGGGEPLIYINSELAGKGNLTKELTPGTYHIVVKEDSLQWNASVIADTIYLDSCEVKKLNYSLTLGKILKTTPEDAYVYSNDTLVGHTPLLLSLSGTLIELRKPGYQSKQININDYRDGDVIQLNYIGEVKGAGFFTTHLYKLLLGGLLVFGGTTAYFKLQADDRYDDYQRTGNPAYLTQTRRLDLISGVTFGMLQINFGYLLYRILTD